MTQTYLWIGFIVFLFLMLGLDLYVSKNDQHPMGMRKALLWSAFWVGLAALFNVFVYFYLGKEKALNFLAGYLLEESLSVDNLFVFILVFSLFRVPEQYQRKVLFWGIIGAQVMRAIFIALGVTVIHRFAWIIYIFGAFLIYTGLKLAFQKDKEIHPENNPVLRIFRKFMGVTEQYENGFFFVKRNGKTLATPLFIVLLVIETTDVIFAVDSIPAVLAITTDPFIVYTSNIFAILGLRALFFALAGLIQLFHYLNYGLSFILIFIGVKMLISEIYPIPIQVALGFILGILTLSIAASLIWPPPKKEIPT